MVGYLIKIKQNKFKWISYIYVKSFIKKVLNRRHKQKKTTERNNVFVFYIILRTVLLCKTWHVMKIYKGIL